LVLSVIAAVRSLDGSGVEPALIVRMLGAGRLVAFGGESPLAADIEATWVEGEVGLGEARFGLTEELRPGGSLRDDQRDLVLAWDGRLDNRDDLLISLGSGRSGPAPTDDMLVLDAYARWGVTCIDRLLGDFAFVLWDGRERRLFAARDHIGVRPLHYAFDGRSLVVASRIGQVLEGAHIERRLNETVVADCLGLNPSNPTETPFQGVWRVPAAHVLQHDRGARAPRIWRYWELRERPVITYRSDDEYVAHFREVAGKAVRSRLRSPGPVGVMLSGGLDSSTIACLASELLDTHNNGRLATFTAVFDRLSEADEQRYVEALVSRRGFEAHYVAADEMWTSKDATPRAGSWDEPFEGILDGFAGVVFDRVQQEKVCVLLDGHGGNTLFGGSMYYLLDLLLERRWAVLAHELRCWPWTAWPRIVQRYVIAPLCGRRPGRDLIDETAPKLPEWVRSEFAARCEARRRLRVVYPPRQFRRPSGQYEADAIALFQAWAGLRFLQSEALRRGIDLRHPLFDVRLIDFFLRIPSSQKVQNGCNKALVRRAMGQVFPAIIAQRRGPNANGDFMKLLDRGLRERQRDRWEACLATDFHLAELGYVDPGPLRDALGRYVAGENEHALVLAYAFRLEQWLRYVFGGGDAGSVSAATARGAER
jgi:asparagine synthase (glutamine-hydrolysing)